MSLDATHERQPNLDFEAGWQSPAERVFRGLREYQAAAVAEVLRSDVLSPIVEAPTGSGKAWMIAALAQEYSRSGRVLMATHRDTLVRQNHDVVFRKAGLRPTFYGAGLGSKEWGKITFGNIASLHSVAKKTPHLLPHPIAAIVIDECHRVPNEGGGMFRTLIEAVRTRNPECRLIGMSATPFRGNGASLTDEEGALFDEIVFSIGVRELIDQGVLVRPVPYKADNSLDLSKLKVRAGEYRDEEQAIQIDEAISEIAAEMLAAADKHNRRAAVAMLPRVKQSEALAAALRNLGQPAVSVTAGTPNREAILQRFREGRIRFLTSVSVLVEGFDATVCDMVALIRATKSPIVYIQSVGRGLRPHEGKTNCLVLDFGGNTQRFGPIDNVRMPKAGKHGASQEKECPSCSAIIPKSADVCPECGHMFGGGDAEPKKLNGRSNTEQLLSDPKRNPKVGDTATFAPDRWSFVSLPGRGSKPRWGLITVKGEGREGVIKLYPNHGDKARRFFESQMRSMCPDVRKVHSVIEECFRPSSDTMSVLDRLINQEWTPPARVSCQLKEFEGRKSWEVKRIWRARP